MKKLIQIIFVFGIMSQLSSCNCVECNDEKSTAEHFENADLKIDSLSIIKKVDDDHFTVRTRVAYINDDSAYDPKLLILLPSNEEPVQILGNIRTSSDSVRCIHPRNGCIECTLSKRIDPLKDGSPQYFWVEADLRSKIKNVSAFVYSQTPDYVQCNNFKHISEK